MKDIGKRFIAVALVVSAGIIVAACGLPAENGGGESAKPRAAAGEKNKQTNAENKAAEEKSPSETDQANLVEVYDGRKAFKRSQKKAADGEKQLVEDQFKSSETIIKQRVKQYCYEDEPGESAKTGDIVIDDVAEGAFTKPGSKQKAYLYMRCELGRGFGIGGIMIVENKTAVANYVYDSLAWNSTILALTDINKNGLSEIVLLQGSSHQGYSADDMNLFEFKAENLENLGGIRIYESDSGAVENSTTTALKITVQPSAGPVFFRERYEKKGEANKWSLKKKSEKFSMNKASAPEFVKIDQEQRKP